MQGIVRHNDNRFPRSEEAELVPTSAADRSRMIRRALADAGYAGSVTSSPSSHRAQVTTVRQSESLDSIAIYLGGYLRGLASAKLCNGFVSVEWGEQYASRDRSPDGYEPTAG